jgi:murein DD-endopeptidase MepM/ murein hydrolase activator NlpD
VWCTSGRAAALLVGTGAAAVLAAAAPSVSAAGAPGRRIAAAAPPAAVGSYAPPLPALLVVRGFDPPATRYGAGHLGVDLRADTGARVLAAGAGIVRFAGPVAGRGVVVIAHSDGVSTEYEPVRALVRPGAVVTRGEPIGVLDGTHPGCPGRCLHWGARRASAYLDPLSLLRPLGVVRLLPWRGPAP